MSKSSSYLMGAMSKNGSAVSCEAVNVTPEMAAVWLERNTRNRAIAWTRVSFYAEQMQSGEWKFTHQGIAFDEFGELVDGQHRLWAVRYSGVTVKMMVTRGMKRDGMIAIDGGRPRSAKDAMHLIGHDCTTRHLATARIILASYVYSRRPESKFDIAYMASNERLMRFHLAVKDAVEFGMISGKSEKGLSHACVGAALGCAWFTENRELLSDFKEQFESGVIRSDADVSAARLRNFMLSSTKTRGGREARTELFVRSCTAIRAYLARKPISKLYAVEESIFRIPDIAGFTIGVGDAV